jgi:hypothetical protein
MRLETLNKLRSCGHVKGGRRGGERGERTRDNEMEQGGDKSAIAMIWH